MVDFFVDDTATGANDGTSFADAFTSVTSVTTLAVGDRVLIASTHDEDTTNYDFPDSNGRSEVLSVNSGTEIYEAGAAITDSGNLGFRGQYVRGLTITTTSDVDTASQREEFEFEDCTIVCDSFQNNNSGHLLLRNCDVTLTDTTFGFFVQSVEMFGGSISSTSLGAGDGIFVASTFDGFNARLYGVDLTGVTNAAAIFDMAGAVGVEQKMVLWGCRLPTTPALVLRGSRGKFECEAIGCETGVITDPTVAYRYEAFGCICETDTAVNRTDGASDGTTTYSYSLTAVGDETIERSLPARIAPNGISVYVPASATNVRIYLAHNGVGQGTSGALDTSECWAEYLGPSELGSATTQLARLESARARIGETPIDLTTDTSTWNGTGVGTIQRIDIPVNPTVAGWAAIWVYLATGDASDVTIHVDPKVDVT